MAAFTKQLFHRCLFTTTAMVEADVAAALKSCGRNKDIFEGRRIHAWIQASQLHRCSVYLHNMAIEMYGKCGSPEEAELAIQQMPVLPNEFSRNILLQAYVCNARLEQAGALFAAMHRRTEVTWNVMVTAVAANGNPLSVLRRMPGWGVVANSARVAAYAKLGLMREARDALLCGAECNVIGWNALLAAYSRRGDFEDAKTTFDLMAAHDAVSFDAMLQSLATIGDNAGVKALFDAMPQRDVASWTIVVTAAGGAASLAEARAALAKMPHHDVVCIAAMVQAYAERGLVAEAAKPLFDASAQRNVVSWSSLIVGYACVGDLESLLVVFDRLPQRDAFCWNSLLTAFAQHGHLDDAERVFFESMPQRGLVSWNAMLAAYAHNGRPEAVAATFKRQPARDTVSWNAAIAAAALAGEPAEAKSIFDDAPQADAVSWNALLSAYAATSRGDEATAAFDRMPRRDVISWTAVAACLAQSGRHGEADAIFGAMPRRNHVSWIAMVVAYAHRGHVDKARALLARTPYDDVRPWREVMTAYANGGQAAAAMELLKQVELMGIEPDAALFMHALSACRHAGLLKQGRQCFLYMQSERGVSPTSEHYACIVDLLGRAGQLRMAQELLEAMPFLPDDIAWGSLLGGCKIHRDVECGLNAAKKAFVARPDNGAILLLLSQICADVGLKEQVGEVRRCMEAVGLGAKKPKAVSTLISPVNAAVNVQ